MEHYSDDSHINVGTGVDLSIKELAEAIRDVVNPTAHIRWDTSKPDGTPRKLLDVSRLRALGWDPTIELRAGLASTYEWFVDRIADDTALRGVGTHTPA
jgi:GDP-L-fucose synthase